MNERKSSQSSAPDIHRAMEGRTLQNGQDQGDAQFHEIAWATTPIHAAGDLEELARCDISLAEQWVEGMVLRDREIGILAYRSLLALYPSHPNSQQWNKRLADLKQ